MLPKKAPIMICGQLLRVTGGPVEETVEATKEQEAQPLLHEVQQGPCWRRLHPQDVG